MVKIGFIGAGKVGTALAIQLRDKGYNVTAVASRSRTSAERLVSFVDSCHIYDTLQGVADNTNFIFITTPDDVIEQIASQVNWHAEQSIVHCSGAGSLDILETARKAGARVGGFHPLQTFASIDHAIKNLPGSTFALEGNGIIVDQLIDMAKALKGSWVRLGAGDKVLYHAAAVMACNYVVTLMKMATDLWKTFDVPAHDATQSLVPLLQGTVNNINNIGIPHCLTGPIARGDVGTIKKHIIALKEKAPEILSTYKELGIKTIPIAVEKGTLSKEAAKEIEKLLLED
ncbi:MAG: DUF2520 domain-containing protein [Chloroflexi bacterium]|nr:DUF2520 domain-containing protein [Chloroflexota bacterium]